MENLKKIILLFICMVPLVGSTQITFFNKYTSGPFDTGNGIAQLPDSSYAVTGSSDGFNDDSGQAFLMLIDSTGNHLWTKDYGGAGDDIGVRVIHVPNDGFFIAGYTGSTLEGDFDFVVYKTDEQGDLQWEKRYGGPNWEKLRDAKLLADGGLILVGQVEGPTTDGVDMFLVRTDALGDSIWTKTIQTPQDDIIYAVDTISNNQFVIGGDLGDSGVLKGMLAGFNIDGTQEWLEFYDHHGITSVRALTVFDSNIYMVGGIYNNDQTRCDMWYGKGDMNGAYVNHWMNTYSESTIFNSIAIRDAVSVFMGMNSQAVDFNPFPGGDDIHVYKMGTTMYFHNFSHNFSAMDNDAINQMIATNDGGIVLVGTVSADKEKYSLGTDILIARIGPADEVTFESNDGLDFVGLNQEKVSMLALHPNPTNDLVIFPENVQGLKYNIINFQGKVVMSGKIESAVSLMNLNPGIYIVKVEDQSSVWTGKIVKQ